MNKWLKKYESVVTLVIGLALDVLVAFSIGVSVQSKHYGVAAFCAVLIFLLHGRAIELSFKSAKLHRCLLETQLDVVLTRLGVPMKDIYKDQKKPNQGGQNEFRS